MKAVFITYNQAFTDRISATLDRLEIRGFTKWVDTLGRGTFDGEPHYGSHAWPSMNSSIMAVVEDERVEPLLAELRALNESAPQQGLRAFVWAVEQSV